jgi:hypothetical protein
MSERGEISAAAPRHAWLTDRPVGAGDHHGTGMGLASMPARNVTQREMLVLVIDELAVRRSQSKESSMKSRSGTFASSCLFGALSACLNAASAADNASYLTPAQSIPHGSAPGARAAAQRHRWPAHLCTDPGSRRRIVHRADRFRPAARHQGGALHRHRCAARPPARLVRPRSQGLQGYPGSRPGGGLAVIGDVGVGRWQAHCAHPALVGSAYSIHFLAVTSSDPMMTIGYGRLARPTPFSAKAYRTAKLTERCRLRGRRAAGEQARQASSRPLRTIDGVLGQPLGTRSMLHGY